MEEKEEREQSQSKMDKVLTSLSKLTGKNKVIPIKKINFALLDDDRFQKFCYQLRNNEFIKQLWINNCRFNQIPLERWRTFCQAIRANSTIRILTLQHTCLFGIADLGKEYWEEFTFLFTEGNFIDDKDNTNGKEHRDGKEHIGSKENINYQADKIANTHIYFLELFQTHMGNIDEPSWIAFCKAIESSATLRFLSISGQDLMKLSQYETGWATFCKMIQLHPSIQSLQIIGDFHLPISCWLRFFTAIQNNQILKYLKFENCLLWYLSNEHVDALLKTIGTHPSITKFSLQGSKINFLNEERWGALCNAIQFNKNLKTLKLEKNHLNLISLNQWEKFCKAIALNRSLTKLFIGGNGIENITDARWRTFLQAAIDHIQLNSVDIGSRRNKINQRIEKSLSEYSEFEITRTDKLENLLNIKRKFRKTSALALGHSLYAFRLKGNDLHTRFFSKRIITHILTYFDSKRLTDQIIIEVERHLERVRIEKAKIIPKPDSIAEISDDDKKNKNFPAKKGGCVIC